MTTTLPRSEPTSPVQALLERLHDRHAGNTAGEVASYIPELALASPDWFGIALVTADGNIYEVGETQHEFTIQSISKPLTYALALEALGEDEVRRHVDVEPSGDAFNSITLQPGTGIPLNPMVNAGAIATTSLIKPEGGVQPIDRILAEYSAFAGRRLEVDEAVFESENRTGHRNRAIAYLLKNADVLDDEVEDIVETYFRQCSTLVSGRDLALIAATLASTGVNPITKERVLREDTVRSVLSVMASCGMYDAAGDWLYSVGLPAKSGVAGGIVAVLPGQLGIAVYSPPLDLHGNSVRGVKVCEDLSEELHLHVMSPQRRPAPPVRRETTCSENHSKHLRHVAEQAILRDHGSEVRVIELQGEILFAAGELITNAVLNDVEGVKYAVLDFAAVREIDPVVIPIISHLVESFEENGIELVFSSTRHRPRIKKDLVELRDEAGLHRVRTFPDLDLALEWCENELLLIHGGNPEPEEIPISEHPAALNMNRAQIEKLSARLERREYPAGTRIYEQVGHVEEMLFVVKGNVNVMTMGSDGQEHRITTFSSGMTLGEVAMLSERKRLGRSDAADDVIAFALSREDLAEIRAEDPELVCILLENLMKLIAMRVGQMSRDLFR